MMKIRLGKGRGGIVLGLWFLFNLGAPAGAGAVTNLPDTDKLLPVNAAQNAPEPLAALQPVTAVEPQGNVLLPVTGRTAGTYEQLNTQFHLDFNQMAQTAAKDVINKIPFSEFSAAPSYPAGTELRLQCLDPQTGQATVVEKNGVPLLVGQVVRGEGDQAVATGITVLISSTQGITQIFYQGVSQWEGTNLKVGCLRDLGGNLSQAYVYTPNPDGSEQEYASFGPRAQTDPWAIQSRSDITQTTIPTGHLETGTAEEIKNQFPLDLMARNGEISVLNEACGSYPSDMRARIQYLDPQTQDVTIAVENKEPLLLSRVVLGEGTQAVDTGVALLVSPDNGVVRVYYQGEAVWQGKNLYVNIYHDESGGFVGGSVSIMTTGSNPMRTMQYFGNPPICQ